MSWERMIFIFKTHPFNMSFREIKAMTFKQAVLMIKEWQNVRTERQKSAEAILNRTKDTMPTFDIARGIYE